MEILNEARRQMQELSRIGDFFEKNRLKRAVLRQGDYTFVGTR